MRAGLDILPTWALAPKAIANRQVIAVIRSLTANTTVQSSSRSERRPARKRLQQ
jgi:hypothetical protein